MRLLETDFKESGHHTEERTNFGEFLRIPDDTPADENKHGTLSRSDSRLIAPAVERLAEQLLRLRLRASHGSFIAIG